MATDAQTLLSAAACYDCGADAGQQQLYRLALLQQIALALNPSAVTDPQTLLNEAACYQCLTPGMQMLAELALLAQIASSLASGGGGGGIGEVLAGTFSNPNGNITPTDTATGALYYQTDVAIGSQVFWQWNTTAQNWTELI